MSIDATNVFVIKRALCCPDDFETQGEIQQSFKKIGYGLFRSYVTSVTIESQAGGLGKKGTRVIINKMALEFVPCATTALNIALENLNLT